ncbi:MAG: NAD(P)/FAD-dependent oxidoreductase [Spirochaetales bacterium]|nr:NAD(P)/FAD-dependent oxidoreductase [Spirochaetales bacterium]
MKKIIIIGAGIAGLSAGIYARKNGYDVTIYEMHYLPGGMCTAWKRGGFTFEGCMHFLGFGGASPAYFLYHIWQELGVLPDKKIIHHELANILKDTMGRTLHFYTDINRLEKELLRLSPSDAQEIKTLCKTAKRIICFIRTTGKNPFRFIAKMAGILRGIPLLKKYADINIGEYAARFKDPLLRHALTSFLIYPDISCVQIFFFLAMQHIKGIGYPEGSSLLLARTVECIFLGLNGKINYKKKVKRIIVNNGRATGIELEDGKVESADIIISAADGHSTLYNMLEDKFTTPTLHERYASQPLFNPFVQVSLGVNRDMTNTPHSVRVEMSSPFEIAGQTQRVLWYQHSAFDPTLAPRGKTSITILYLTDFARWEKIDYRSEKYKALKKDILETTIAQLEKTLPGISSQIEVSDVATPFTTIRYTNNWQAAFGFMLTKKIIENMVMKPQYTLPGLENFYMSGQWVRGPGVIMAAVSGKEVVQKICEADRRKFKVK